MKKRFLCFIICIFMLIAAFSLRISRFYGDSCEIYAQNGIKAAISNELNRYIIEELALKDIDYSQIAQIKYSQNGKVELITVDTVKINIIATDIAIDLTEEIKNAKNSFGIPLGNTLGIAYLSGIGPDIGVTIIPVGYVKYEINSQLISGGINQTLHRICVNFTAEVDCIAPFNKEKIFVESSVVLAETIIIGEVPQVLIPSV